MSEQAVNTEVVAPTPEQAEQETASALSAGYNKVRGDSPTVAAPKVEQEPVAEEKQDEKKDENQPKEEAAQAADPWAGVPPILKEEFERARIAVNQVGTAQRHIKVLEDQIAELKAAGEAAKAAAPGTAPTAGQIQAAASSGEKWKAIKEDFPEWAEAMEERLAAQAATPQAPVDVEKLRKEWQEGTQVQVAGAIDVAEERAFVRFKYPTWKQTVNTPEFIGWMQTQAPEIQALAQSDLADDAIKMLDEFSEHQKTAAAKAAADAKNKQRLAAATPPRQAASGGPTILPDEAGLAVGYNRIARKRA